MKYSQLISSSLLIISSIFLLCTVFATDNSLENGIVSGKVHWFHISMLFMAVSSLIAIILIKPTIQFTFSMADGLVLVLAAIIVFTYNWQLNPEPEKMLFGGQLIVLWFLLRFIFTGWPQLRLLFLTAIIVTGLVEAVLGIRQLHGFEESNHSLFRLTGDFYNPGPYSGYLALVLPICLWIILEFDHCKREGWRQIKIYLYYLAWITLLAIIVVLPAGMSRTAWITAIVSCAWVYWKQRIGWRKIKIYIYEYRTLTIVSFVLILVSVVGALTGIFLLKQDSANGRLLLWKITGQAIMEQSGTGTGLGGFPAAYAEAQAKFFASGKASETEMKVAGCPDYGFNEFLQIGLEQGIVGLIFFALLLSYSLFQGVKNRQTGATGGILALTMFSLASYPLQLPEFWIILVILMGITNTNILTEIVISPLKKGEMTIFIFVVGILTVCSGGIFCLQNKYYQGYKMWYISKMLHNSKDYDTANDKYEKLVPLMKHKPELLFETALCLNNMKQYMEANKLLYRAMELSCDPMIYYIAAKNEQALGNYQKAENLLLHAIEILPERIYPYYLLTKLYSETAFFQEDKFIKAADAVLTKEPKVESTAIREMRTEVKKMLKNIRENRN